MCFQHENEVDHDLFLLEIVVEQVEAHHKLEEVYQVEQDFLHERLTFVGTVFLEEAVVDLEHLLEELALLEQKIVVGLF